MIEKLNFNLTLTKDEYLSLIAIKAWQGKYWRFPPNNDIENIISKIRSQLDNNQSKCAYCGIKFKDKGDSQVEHIAAKSDTRPPRHPEFTFTLKNLVLACVSCNGFSKKSTQETIANKHKTYSKCTFTIVHPYFDNPDDHYDWVIDLTAVVIQVKNGSPKGAESIRMFGLDSPEMTELRAGQKLLEDLKREMPLSFNNEDLLNRILNR